MIRISINSGEAQKRLQDMREKLGDTTPLMRRVGGIMLNSAKTNFLQGGRPKWVVSARAEREGGITLQKSGVLMRSVHSEVGRNFAIVGTNIKYAAIHQFGGLIRRKQVASIDDFRPFDGRPTKLRTYAVGEMPARPFLRLTEVEDKNIEKAAVAFLGDKK